ncbi:DMT family transporter [Mangrovicoccus algicola]|uniref:DMT family transporter n=1 Tax=Mangrovicoccus algicola TaxID=2771008 RepID=A0A8J6Z9W4_9RHOB|nr:DMT family transporter [Mangrovicoccus algicola]MBE3638741.1 DMT family transporter [Mangrovicoccus algicola]
MSPITGILLKIASVFLMTAMSALIKYASDTVPPGEAVFFRSLFAFPPLLVWLAMRGELRHGLRTDRPLGHLWRGLVGGTAMGLMFLGLSFLPLPEVTAIFYATPIFVTIFAAMFLGEPVRAFRVATVVTGLAGVLVVMQPRLTALNGGGDLGMALGALAVFTATVFAAMAQITVRHLTKTEHIAAIVFYFTATTTALSLLTLPFGWVMPQGPVLWALIGAGLLGGVGQILLTASYRHADAAVIASFEFISIVLAILVGYAVFAEIPTVQMMIGAALVVASGLALAWREHRLKIAQAKVKLVR